MNKWRRTKSEILAMYADGYTPKKIEFKATVKPAVVMQPKQSVQ
jgi:hypothetical protein